MNGAEQSGSRAARIDSICLSNYLNEFVHWKQLSLSQLDARGHHECLAVGDGGGSIIVVDFKWR